MLVLVIYTGKAQRDTVGASTHIANPANLIGHIARDQPPQWLAPMCSGCFDAQAPFTKSSSVLSLRE